MTSHEVEGETDTSNEEGAAAQEHTARVGAAEAAQDAPRLAPGGKTYALQCNVCFKLRIIPSKELYESIGERILEKPFVCADAQAWGRVARCDDPADIEDNEPGVRWAIDTLNIPRAPDGFNRDVHIRSENVTQFADIYFKDPGAQIKLNSMVQVQTYLDEHPESNARKEQFSFIKPREWKGSFKEGVKSNLKWFMKNEGQPSAGARQRTGGSPEVKTPAHGQLPRPQSLAKSNEVSGSEPNTVRQDKPKGAPHPMAVKRLIPNAPPAPPSVPSSAPPPSTSAAQVDGALPIAPISWRGALEFNNEESNFGQSSRPPSLVFEAPLAQPKDLSASKPSAVRRQGSPKSMQPHGFKGAPHPMAARRKKPEADEGAR